MRRTVLIGCSNPKLPFGLVDWIVVSSKKVLAELNDLMPSHLVHDIVFSYTLTLDTSDYLYKTIAL